MNCTFKALIPKIDSQQSLLDYRLISVVGCMYNMLAKVLANRLKGIIGNFISDTNSPFVKGR